MNLRQLVDPDLVFTDLAARDRDAVLRELAGRLQGRGAIRSADELFAKLLEREQLGSTAVGKGVAIPHCKLKQLDRVVVAVGTVPDGIAVEAPDGEPVRVFFLLASPEDSPAEHLQALAAISKWLRDGRNLERIRTAASTEELSASLQSAGDGGDRG
jgi:PTS system nitrogen regulatory IIA component